MHLLVESLQRMNWVGEVGEVEGIGMVVGELGGWGLGRVWWRTMGSVLGLGMFGVEWEDGWRGGHVLAD